MTTLEWIDWTTVGRPSGRRLPDARPVHPHGLRVGAGFLLMIYLSMPPFPGLPTPPAEGNVFFINKNFYRDAGANAGHDRQRPLVRRGWLLYC